MNAAFGDAIRAGARRVVDGGAREPEVAGIDLFVRQVVPA